MAMAKTFKKQFPKKPKINKISAVTKIEATIVVTKRKKPLKFSFSMCKMAYFING